MTSEPKSTWPCSVEISAATSMLARLHLLHEIVVAALAEIIVDPDHRDILHLELVMQIVGDLRHRELLAEGGSEHPGIALRRDVGGLGADDLRDLGLLGQRHVDLDRAGIDRPEHHIGILVQNLLHLRARDTGIALGVEMLGLDLSAQNAAGGVDLVDRKRDAVAPIGAGDGAGAGELDHVGDVDGALRAGRARRKRCRQRNGERSCKMPHDVLPFAFFL